MPYRKTYKKRSFKKRYGNKYSSKTKKLVTGQGPTMLEQIASGAGSIAKVAQAVMPAIMAINTEHKYFDKTASVTSHTPGTNDQIINLTGEIAQNVTDSGRIGNSILAKDLQLRCALSFPSSTTVVGIHCRLMLLVWKEDITSNAPSAAKIFEQPNNLYSPVNKDHSDQFVVVKDKFFNLNAQNGALSGIQQAFTSMKIFKSLNFHQRWNNALASQNHVYLVLRSSATGASNAMNCTYYSRLNYTDN